MTMSWDAVFEGVYAGYEELLAASPREEAAVGSHQLNAAK
jgi:hypothetical protein